MLTLPPDPLGAMAASGDAGREFATGAAVASPPERLRPVAERVRPLPQREGDEFQEYFQTLLRNLPWPSRGSARRLTTVGLTSCYRREGVSTIAVRTALAAARTVGHHVLLVDANLTHPSVHELFHVRREPGLANVVLDDHPLEAALQPLVAGRLSLLTAGRGGSAGAWAAVAGWATLLARLQQDFALAVFDLPATSEIGSAMQLFGLFDGVVLVVEHERVRWEVAQRKRQGLLRAQANLVGVAFNKRTEHIPAWLYRTL